MLVMVVMASAGCSNELLPLPIEVEDPASTLPAAILWAHPYPRLLIEIDYVAGREPSQLALATLRATLEDSTDKEQIVINPPTQLPTTDRRFEDGHEWTIEELASVHDQYFDAQVSGAYGEEGTARLHVLYLSGSYEMNSTFHGLITESTVGLRLRDALILFPDTFSSFAPQVKERPWDVYSERRTLIHELGHAMGLVDNGIPMQRPHVAPDGVHSNNEKSVMSPRPRQGFPFEMAQDNEWMPYKFDQDDLADLNAFREIGRAAQRVNASVDAAERFTKA